jgi:hypothetical protein
MNTEEQKLPQKLTEAKIQLMITSIFCFVLQFLLWW